MIIRASERMGGGGGDPSRPMDWLEMPIIANGDECINCLISVWDHDGNFVALSNNEPYAVDWGQGTVVDYAAGEVAQRNLVFSEYPASSLTVLGYRQAIVRIFPQPGAHLVQVDLAKSHSDFTTSSASNFLLEVHSSGSSLQFVRTKSNTFPRYLRAYRHFGVCNFTSMFDMFSNSESLKYVAGIAPAQDLNFSRALGYSAIERVDSEVIDLQNITDFNQTFRDCSAMRYFAGDLSAATNMGLAFLNCRSLSQVEITGLRVSTSFSGCALAAAELNQLFSDLVDLTANGLPAATITITGNHGAASCDPSIATAKGWTVTV